VRLANRDRINKGAEPVNSFAAVTETAEHQLTGNIVQDQLIRTFNCGSAGQTYDYSRTDQAHLSRF